MEIAYDCETYKEENGKLVPVLDGTGDHFILGCVMKDSGKKEFFTNKEDMWNYIIELGKKEMKRGKKLVCRAHNAKYDFFQIADLKDKKLRWFAENPLIAGYYFEVIREFNGLQEYKNWRNYSKRNNIYHKIVSHIDDKIIVSYNKEGIKFLDSMSLFAMSLKKVGELVKIPKLELPEEFLDGINKEEMNNLKVYCANDCKIVLEGVKYVKAKLKEEGVNIRNLITINQIAISYIINKLVALEQEHILYRNKDGSISESTYKTNYKEEIHAGYRGGYVRVWKTGFLEDLSAIDKNSLYPYSAIEMRFPDLRTEEKIKEPLKKYDLNTIISRIGISRCIVRMKDNPLGLLSVRLAHKSHVPTGNKFLIGTWTHIELREAIKEGYEILDIEWSVTWDEGPNPFKIIYNDLYNKRISSKEEFDNYFYKMMMNGSIGKFAQTRMNQELFIDSVEKVDEYLARNYLIIKEIEGETDLMFLNKNVDFGKMKKYYAPMISALTTGYARVLMYRAYKKVPLDKICYSDTDNIITIGDYSNLFEIGNEMGKFKIEKDKETKELLINQKGVIWGTKSKSIGNNIALSGVVKSSLNLEDFYKGEVKVNKMEGLKSDLKPGTFITSQRDLKKQKEEFKESEESLNKIKLFIDYDIQDITYFKEVLKKYSKEIENDLV